jgi:membrane-associated phospholipid phosphatase
MRRRLLEMDARLSSSSRLADRPGPVRNLAAIFAHSGDSWFWLLGLGLLWLAGDDFWKYRAGVLALGIAITAVMVLAIKFTVRRQRPQGEWGRIYRNADPHSFPSGHAARATMLALLALGLGPAWFGALLLVWAPLVGLARVSMGVHYLSDILAGMALGATLGFLITRFV